MNTEDVPTLDKSKVVKIPWAGPEPNTRNMYLIDLFGLSLDQVATIRKVDIYFNNVSTHSETFLDAAFQLSQQQGAAMFAHIASTEIESRPDGLKPSSARPPTLSDLEARPVPLLPLLRREAMTRRLQFQKWLARLWGRWRGQQSQTGKQSRLWPRPWP